MARRVEASGEQPPSVKQVDNELATAQILAGFQNKRTSRSKKAECTEQCHTQALDTCVKECELPCTADCTDACVVVCEAPHRINEDLCCDFQDACDKRDCQYSYLDESCCFGCEPNNFPLLDEQAYGTVPTASFDLPNLHLYHQHHPLGLYQQDFHGDNLNGHHLDYRSICYNNIAMSHCAMACHGNSIDTYEGSPIPSLTQSTADSPFSLQSSISGPSIRQYPSLPTTNPDNPPGVLAGYTANDLTFFSSTESVSSPENLRIKVHDIDGLSGTAGFEIATVGPDLTPGQMGNISGEIGFSNLESVAKLPTDHQSKIESTILQCCWVTSDSENRKLCGQSFGSREDLHKHIIDEHVKSMKKRGLSTSSLHPICYWHGCESARKKKVFKLQHLKDHIVCHSKLRMKCEICGKECRDAKVLKLHMNTHRPGQEKPFRCDFEGCTASFGTSALLSSHKRVHTGEKPHQCSWCEYRAADKGNLRRHEEEMHMGRKWPCPYCSQKLAKKANLTRHIRDLHANELQDAPLELK